MATELEQMKNRLDSGQNALNTARPVGAPDASFSTPMRAFGVI